MNTYGNNYEDFAKLVDQVYTHKNCHICDSNNPTCLMPSPYMNEFTVYFTCEHCMNAYLKYYHHRFRRIQKREYLGHFKKK